LSKKEKKLKREQKSKKYSAKKSPKKVPKKRQEYLSQNITTTKNLRKSSDKKTEKDLSNQTVPLHKTLLPVLPPIDRTRTLLPLPKMNPLPKTNPLPGKSIPRNPIPRILIVPILPNILVLFPNTVLPSNRQTVLSINQRNPVLLLPILPR